jgi:hypothetical protein
LLSDQASGAYLEIRRLEQYFRDIGYGVRLQCLLHGDTLMPSQLALDDIAKL